MKSIITPRYTLFIILFTLIQQAVFSQHTTEGKDFWLAFGQNANYNFNTYDYQIRVVAKQATTVTLTFTNNGTVITQNLTAGEVRNFVLTEAQKENVYNSETGKTKKTVRIQSTEDISVYALNLHSATTDATNLLPTDIYGTTYYHMTYTSTGKDGFIVIAIVDGTNIEINGTVVATLNQGEAYTLYNNITDNTGLKVSSDKPIAYYNVNSSTQIPNGVSYMDNLFQQLMPTDSWGTRFIVPVSHRGTERIRIVASQNNTIVSQQGGTIVSGLGAASLNLNEGEFVELEIKLVDKGCYIESDKPIQVASFLMGSSYSNVGIGDPAMAYIPPIEQAAVTSLTITPFIAVNNTQLSAHYALIAVPQDSKAETYLWIDGTASPLSGGNWVDNDHVNYSFYTMPLSLNKAYTYENINGLILLGYGIGTHESYYYLAGAAARKLSPAFYINDIHYQDADGQTICNQDITFRLNVDFALSTNPGHIKWYINNVEVTEARDQYTWNRAESTLLGTNTISVTLVSYDDEIITLNSTITIEENSPGTIGNNQNICENQVPAQLVSLTLPTGGVGTYLYQWQISNDGGGNWVNIDGATGINYQPANLNSTTYYRRRVRSDCGTAYSNTVVITVNNSAELPANIEANPVCEGQDAIITIKASVNNYIYKIYDAAVNGNLISSGTGTGNDLDINLGIISGTGTKSYYIEVDNGCTSLTRKQVTITVNTGIVAGTIGNNQIICNNTVPAALVSVSTPSGGDGIFSYQWQRSENGVSNWTDITGAVSISYSPPALTEPVFYRRAEINQTCGIVYSNVVEINIKETNLIYPDVRIKACNENTINLTKYTDTEDFSSIKWMPSAEFNNGGINDGTLKDATLLKQGQTYRYPFTVTNTCSDKAEGVLYLTVSRQTNPELNVNEVKICYMDASAINLNRIFGIEANGSWSCSPSSANNYLTVISSGTHAGSAVFNGFSAWNDGVGTPENGTLKIDITFTPTNNNCFTTSYKITLILTDDLI